MPETNSQQIATPSVLVTGANRNIGAHIAHRLIDDGYGVIAHYRSATHEIERLAARGARLVTGEFGDAASCLAIAQQITAELADAALSLRAIVHNASSFTQTAADPEAAAAQFQAFFETHMLAPYLLNTKLAPYMQASIDAPGDIIHITDIYADNPGSDTDIYCATKAGLQNLAQSFAKRLAPAIKVNAIQPGPISFESWHDEASRKKVMDATLLARMGTPEAIYAAVSAIMNNDFQTGAVIAVDGGRRLSQ